MFNVRLAGGHLYGKQLFTWLSLVVSLMASFVLSFIPLDVLDENWDLIESVSEGFLTFSLTIPKYLIHRRRLLKQSNDQVPAWSKNHLPIIMHPPYFYWNNFVNKIISEEPLML